jgi:hypothetical protein
MTDCLSENEVAELACGALDDTALAEHLDRCPTCLALVAGAVRASTPATHARFAIVRQLGAGGMGTVYEAFDRERHARVALKVLRHVGPNAILRFKREFRALQGLHHPNLVRLGELVAEGEHWSFTMELVDGVRFLDHVRSGERAPRDGLGFDDARLRDGFAQLVRGLAVLHAAGKIHRDVKPSNILVTHGGRVVLLDLGLVFDQHSDGDSTGGYPLGTIAYMAPEQALGRRVGPEADWYAAGVLLYQALTGVLPFTGDVADVTAQKQRGPAIPPRAAVPAIDVALSDLCLALLAPDPAARPTANDILAALGDDTAAPLPSPSPSRVPFVGRARELAALVRALEDTRQGQPVAVLVAGESGIGKSALVQRFAEICRGQGTVVLAGRCYERESVPFKAIDGIVDALSRYLSHVPIAEAAAVLPRHAGLLVRAFPVLARVEPIAGAPHGQEVRDPQELRSRLFGAFRELLVRVADRHPVMLVIDDLHWADTDSFALLGELCRPPDAPAVLLVATVRSTAEGGGAQLAMRGTLGTDVRQIPLSPMAADEALALATLLVARQTDHLDLDPSTVVHEANGHPLFLYELIRHDRSAGESAMRLDDVLWARIAQLEPAAQTILQLAALSGGRLIRRVGERAARLDAASFENHLDVLRTANLARTSGASASDRLEPYHDRVRGAVLAHTTATEARALHRQLALALEAEVHPDVEALALHWRETNERARAAEYTTEAAARAARTLAFDRAVHLYRLALELRAADAGDPHTEHGLRVELGHALVNAGRGAEAARVYLVAAEAPGADISDLRRRAAEQLIRSGNIDEGVATLRSALQPLGVAIATRPIQALRSLILRRIQIRLRGLGYRERDPADLPARALARIDFAWSLSSSLSFVDPLVGSDLNALHVLLALRAGEPSRVCRAIASEAVYAASVGAAPRAQRLRSRAREIAIRVNQPYVFGVLGLADGIVSTLLGNFAEALGHMQDTQRILRAGATGVAWELGGAQSFELDLLGWMGRIDELRERVPLALREADSRRDLYFGTEVRVGLASNLVLLAAGEVERARREASDALQAWARPGFQIQHYWHLYAQTQADLYAGDVSAAYDRMVTQGPQLKASLLLRVQYCRIVMGELNIRCTIAAAAERAGTAPSDARALLTKAERGIKRLRNERVEWADALAWLLQAGVAQLRSHGDEAQRCLQHAVERLDAVDMALFATAARARLAALRGGRDGGALADRVTSWFSRHEIRSPSRMLGMLTPAFVGAT